MLSLGHLLEALTDYRLDGNEPGVRSVVIDSREVQPGDVFFAFEGEDLDGHDFVDDALARGAIAVVVERPVAAEATTVHVEKEGAATPSPDVVLQDPIQVVVADTEEALQQWARQWRSRFSVEVTGITGSVGKTSTKELTYAVLVQRFHTLKSQGNYNNEIGLPLTLLNLRPQHEHAVLEMGMYAKGEIALLCDIARPRIGVVTIVGPVHMSRLGSLEAIVEAKRELVEALPADGVAILNRDEPLVMGMAEHTAARVFTYGMDERADLWADQVHSMGLSGVRFTLHHGRDSLRVHVPLLGRHSVHTSLRAAAVGLVAGMAWEEILAGLRDERTQLRLVTERGPRGSLILDDTYNASPESVIAALNLLKDLRGRRIAVLGDMLELGPAEEESHRLVGRRVKGVADVLITVGQRSRLIAEEALRAGMNSNRVSSVDTPQEAVPLLEEMIDRNDVILVKGSRGVSLDELVATLTRRRDVRIKE
ncbi:MAG TPA: UDP-N-acetylmuramoyl-tripeptide--D-alanyl-D-alanine ligase [Candidatus Sulfomarinibacteraceae bacterium]|nr:UDP-N-acetylmuramoyl-tripeptide--D-alanyl-D-alanine ligase [Candidatus Sulfomarinibacteraceae bacterium]